MTILADPVRRGRRPAPAAAPVWVIGVDTHTDTHDATLIDAVGAIVGHTRVAADPAGYQQLQAWAEALLPAGQRVLWAVEGTRSHGHGLTRHLQSVQHQVIEADKPDAAPRRRRGKSDQLDAAHAARSALAADRHAEPRADGPREALRMLLVTRRHDTDMRTATINLFKSLLLGAGDLRETLRKLSATAQARAVLALPAPAPAPAPAPEDIETHVRVAALRRAAQTIIDLGRAVTDNEKALATLVKQTCPGLLDLPGVGPVTAAVLLTVWSHHGRVHSEAAFAMLAGIAPIEASSGRIIRHRLNRGGDRTLNQALHTIITARRRMGHTPTSDYITRRTTGNPTTRKTDKEILRCLKRYAIRSLYRFLEANTIPA